MYKNWVNIASRIDDLRVSVRGEDIPDILVFLLVAAEDHRFKYHCGVDVIALFRAAWRTIFNGRVEGGSTIAMQLVRVVSSRYERTLGRKVLEIFFAVRLATSIPKLELSKIYLYIAYYGWNMEGLNQAFRGLSIDSSNMSLHEAASIVARLKYPEPKVVSKRQRRRILGRIDYILKRFDKMSRVGFL